MTQDKHDLLKQAATILHPLLKDIILSLNQDLEGGQLSIVLNNGIRLYVVYNNFKQYGYQIMKSLKPKEFVRFDNFDERWNVSTSPHHFHPYKGTHAIESPMIGNPTEDLPQLCEWIKENKLFRVKFIPIIKTNYSSLKY